jgi:hypothetical protein
VTCEVPERLQREIGYRPHLSVTDRAAFPVFGFGCRPLLPLRDVAGADEARAAVERMEIEATAAEVSWWPPPHCRPVCDSGDALARRRRGWEASRYMNIMRAGTFVGP